MEREFNVFGLVDPRQHYPILFTEQSLDETAVPFESSIERNIS